LEKLNTKKKRGDLHAKLKTAKAAENDRAGKTAGKSAIAGRIL
jgi:hypothetical protein